MSALTQDLAKQIATKANLNLISYNCDDTKESSLLAADIVKNIMAKSNYKNIELIESMAEVAVTCKFILNYPLIGNLEIKYKIDDEFYEELRKHFVEYNGVDFKRYNVDDVLLNVNKLTYYMHMEIKDSTDNLLDQCGEINLKEINSKLKDYKKQYGSLTKRETQLLKLSIAYNLPIDTTLETEFKSNLFQRDMIQQYLENSYNVIIKNLEHYTKNQQILDQIIPRIESEKLSHTNLFTNAKRYCKLKAKTHWMSFIWDCPVNISQLGHENNIFIDFVKAYLSGYMQYIDLLSMEPNYLKMRKKELKNDLKVLQKYNHKSENLNNINALEQKIKFLSTPKAHWKLIPFKVLANALKIPFAQIIQYIKTIHEVNPQIIKKNFNSLITIHKDICLVNF